MNKVVAPFKAVNEALDTTLKSLDVLQELFPKLQLLQSEVDALSESEATEMREELTQHAEMCEFLLHHPVMQFLQQHRSDRGQEQSLKPTQTVPLKRLFLHYKGNQYYTRDYAVNSNTGVAGVVYSSVKDNVNYWLSFAEFNKMVTVDGIEVPRFKEV